MQAVGAPKPEPCKRQRVPLRHPAESSTADCPKTPDRNRTWDGYVFWSVGVSVAAGRNLSRIASATFTRNSEVSPI